MRFFTWNNKSIADADLLVLIDEREIRAVDALFPEASACCSNSDKTYYCFLDTKRKTIIPMRKLSYAFGGMYNGNMPYGDEVTNMAVNLREYTWDGFAKADKRV